MDLRFSYLGTCKQDDGNTEKKNQPNETMPVGYPPTPKPFPTSIFTIISFPWNLQSVACQF